MLNQKGGEGGAFDPDNSEFEQSGILPNVSRLSQIPNEFKF